MRNCNGEAKKPEMRRVCMWWQHYSSGENDEDVNVMKAIPEKGLKKSNNKGGERGQRSGVSVTTGRTSLRKTYKLIKLETYVEAQGSKARVCQRRNEGKTYEQEQNERSLRGTGKERLSEP